VHQKDDVVGGRYILERFLGAGAFASVWAARDTKLERRVALKILVETLSCRPDVVKRFVREAKLGSKLTHPTIVRVDDVEQSEKGEIYIVMELLEGETLSERLKRLGALDFQESCSIAKLMLQGLASAHEAGVVHRDIKPSNVFLTRRGTAGPPVRLLDFGVAKDLGDDERLTATGHLVGTPMYLAPEVLLGESADAPGPDVDVFAAGLVLFKMLTGRLPLEEDEKRPVHARIADLVVFFKSGRAFPGPADYVQSVPEPIDAMVRRAISVKPDERYRDAREMLAALASATIFFVPTVVKAPAARSDTLRDQPVPAEAVGAPPEEPPPAVEEPPPREDVTLEALDRTEDDVAAPGGDEAAADENLAGTPFQWGIASAPTQVTHRQARRPVAFVVVGLAAVFVLTAASVGALVGWGARAPRRSGDEVAPGRVASPRTEELIASTPAPPVKPPPPPAPARVELRGLPEGAVVTFGGAAVAEGRIEGTEGARGELGVRADGFQPFSELVTISDGAVIDLSGRLAPIATPRVARPRVEKAPAHDHINGRQPGSRIKVLSGAP
jgi:hypothetical protein